VEVEDDTEVVEVDTEGVEEVDIEVRDLRFDSFSLEIFLFSMLFTVFFFHCYYHCY